jgi:predicted transcriptional regulator of viral defense system
MPQNTLEQRLLKLVRSRGVVRPRDLDEIDIPRAYLRRLCDEGLLERPGRGLYVLAGAEPTENATLAEACRRVPQGVVCLLSALRFHDLTSEAPFEIWLALDRKAWLPQVDYPPLRIVRFSGEALTYGVEDHRIDKVPCRIYSAAKTVADCFKYRNKIGLEVALEALRDCRKQRKATADELWQAAKVCRMSNVMRPYLEALA